MANVVPVLATTNPILKFNESGIREIPLSPEVYKIERQAALSTAMQGETKFSYKPNDYTTIVSREMYVEWDCTAVFTLTNVPVGVLGLSLGPDINGPANDAPQAYPISSMCTNCTVMMNAQSVNLAVNQYLELMCLIGDRYGIKEGYESGCVSAFDQQQCHDLYSLPVTSANYPPQAAANVPQMAHADGGGNTDPMQTQGRYTGKGVARQGIQIISITPDNLALPAGNRTIYVRFKSLEPVLLPPFIVDPYNSDGLVGLNSLDLTYTFGDCSRFWSRKHANNTGLLVNITCGINNCSLILNTFKPPQNFQLPATVMYDCPSIAEWETKLPSTFSPANRSVQQAKTNNIILPQVPQTIYVRVARSSSEHTIAKLPWYVPRTFSQIQNLQVDYGQNNTQLASCSTYDLYQQAVKYGLQMSWLQFAQTMGSVVILKIGDNITTPNMGEAPGIQMPNNLTLQLSANDLRPSGNYPTDYAAQTAFVRNAETQYSIYVTVSPSRS